MIIKYLKNDVWGYIDNVRQVANKDIDINKLVKEYDNRILGCPIEEGQDPVVYMNGEKLPEEIIMSNKAFIMATDDLEIGGTKSHSENMLNWDTDENLPASVILLYIEDCKDYDSVVLVTNQTTYLMNDKGQTIERLV